MLIPLEWLLVILGAILGVWIRLGILWLFSPNYARAGALVIVQGFGCFLLGIFRAKKASLTSWYNIPYLA